MPLQNNANTLYVTTLLFCRNNCMYGSTSISACTVSLQLTGCVCTCLCLVCMQHRHAKGIFGIWKCLSDWCYCSNIIRPQSREHPCSHCCTYIRIQYIAYSYNDMEECCTVVVHKGSKHSGLLCVHTKQAVCMTQ